MHWLSNNNRSEFLATPQLVRFDYARGSHGYEPTLLIKTSTLTLKYIVQGVAMHFCCARMGDRLIYAIRINDDESKPAILWSILEREEEKRALIALTRGEICQVFLFNELAVNVAWTTKTLANTETLAEMLNTSTLGPVDHESMNVQTSPILEQFYGEEINDCKLIITSIPNTASWNPLFNHYVTNQGADSPIELFNRNEGSQQEQLAIWLTDNLHPIGAHVSPQIPKGRGTRELTDLLLSYELGSTLIESKTLTIFHREILPAREKLSRDVAKHIQKALRQLKGAIRQLNRGVPVVSISGSTINVEREQPPHAIVMIPDLSLIENRDLYGQDLIKMFMEEAGGFIHILDVSELLRVVQAANIISSRGEATMPMMAFDYYLMERVKKAQEAGTLCIEVVLRVDKN